MRLLLSTLFSKQFLFNAAAYASLFLTIALALWPKLSHLVDLVAGSVRGWIVGYLDFREDIRRRANQDAPEVSSSSRSPARDPHRGQVC